MRNATIRSFLGAFSVVFAASTLFAAQAQANTLDKIKSRGKIIIGVKADYKPFGYVDSDGNNIGLEIDMAHYVAQQLLGSPYDVTLVPVNASNRIQYLRQGRIDLTLATMSDTKKREKVIDFSRNYYASGTALLARKDSGIDSWDDVKGKTVCGIQGSFYNSDLAKRGIQMQNYPGTAEVYKALKNNRCVGFAYDQSALVGKLLDPEWAEDWHIATPAILVTPWGMGTRKSDDALQSKINDIIQKMEGSGYIYALQTKWNIPHTQFVEKRMKKAEMEMEDADKAKH